VVVHFRSKNADPKVRAHPESLHKFYGGGYLRDDLALRAALATVQTLPPSSGRFMAEVSMVADWGSISGFTFAARVAMATEIETCWPLLQTLRSLRTEDWTAQTALIASAIDALSNTSLLQPPTTTRRELSFLSKYLHFCINDAFPLWDGNARTALAHRDDSTTWPSYRGWANKVRQEAEDQYNAGCLGPLRLPGENLVRTLDKALYIIGPRVLRLKALLEQRAKRKSMNLPSGAAQTGSVNTQ